MASEHRPAAAAESRVSRETAARAVEALLKWMSARTKQRAAQLLEHDDLLRLVVTLKKVPHRARTNAHAIPLPHPIHSSALSACLIADDRPSSRLLPDAARALARDLSLPVSDVLALSALRSDYRPFEARRKLCDSYDLFFADRRILPLLPRLLGKHFFKKKKIPVPLQLGRASWPHQLRRCCDSALLFLRTGTCAGVKVGRVSQDPDEIVDNLLAAIEGVVELVPKKWANVRSLHIKSADSLALPIYQAMPEIGLKIALAPKEDKIQTKSTERGAERRKKKSGDYAKKPRYIDNDIEKLNDDVDDLHEEEGNDEFSGLKVRLKRKAKKDLEVIKKKEKRVGKEVIGEDDEECNNAVEGEEVIEEVLGHDNNHLKKKKVKKDAKVKKLKKDQGVDDGLKRKSKTKKLEDKGMKKMKRSMA